MTRSLLAKSILALLSAGITLPTTMQAQDEAITVTVPFQFAIGAQRIDPGTYQFSLASSQFLLSVTNVKTGHVELFPVRPEQQGKIEKRGLLTFGNPSGSAVLTEVHFPGSSTFSEMIERPHAERKELARSGSTSSATSAGRR